MCGPEGVEIGWEGTGKRCSCLSHTAAFTRYGVVGGVHQSGHACTAFPPHPCQRPPITAPPFLSLQCWTPVLYGAPSISYPSVRSNSSLTLTCLLSIPCSHPVGTCGQRAPPPRRTHAALCTHSSMVAQLYATTFPPPPPHPRPPANLALFQPSVFINIPNTPAPFVHPPPVHQHRHAC